MYYTAHGILQARILEWVGFPFSRGSSRPRNRTGVSCITNGFFTNQAISEAQSYPEIQSSPSGPGLMLLAAACRCGIRETGKWIQEKRRNKLPTKQSHFSGVLRVCPVVQLQQSVIRNADLTAACRAESLEKSYKYWKWPPFISKKPAPLTPKPPAHSCSERDRKRPGQIWFEW